MIPLATTTVSVLRVMDAQLYDEPYSGDDNPGRDTVAAGVRAVIDHPAGTSVVAGGVQTVEDYGLVCDPCDLKYLDHVQDDGTGRIYRITWLMAYPNDHIEAGLRIVEGEV